jgi:putative transposase
VGGEGAKFWLSVFTGIKNRGVLDVCVAVCDGLRGLSEAITTTWELAIVLACVIHLIRNTFRFASRKYWGEMSRDLRPVYTAPLEIAARERFTEFSIEWGNSTQRSVSAGRTLGASSYHSWTTTSDPVRDLLQERDRVDQRPLPTRRQGPRALPERHSRPEVPLPRHQSPRPHRKGQSMLGDEMEARPKRIRDSFPRKNQLTQPSQTHR